MIVLKSFKYHSAVAFTGKCGGMEEMAKRTLHNVSNREEARLLVESVKLEERRDYILSVDENMQTALHFLACNNRVDVVNYFCELFPKFDKLLLAKDTNERTALHYAKTKLIAEILVESVSPEKQKELIFSADNNYCTALHVAADNGRTDVVEYLCSLPVKDELLFARNNIGWTALHYSSNQKISQSLVQSVVSEKQKIFLLSVSKFKSTSLHMAACKGRTDVVEYLCSLSLKEELVLAKSDTGRTALHYSPNQKIAQTLLESILPDKRRDFIFSVADSQLTALHVAAGNGRTDVVEYLCSLPVKDELLLAIDQDGCTALHYSSNQKIAQLLVESLKSKKQRYFVYMVNNNKSTALHMAAHNSRADVVQYLCSLYPNNDEQILKKNGYGNTALHVSTNGEIVKALSESVTKELQSSLFLAKNNCQRTALHTAACFSKTDVLYYLSKFENIDDLLLMKDWTSRTALYYVDSRTAAEILINSATEDVRAKLLSAVDKDGQTVLHRAAKFSRTDVIEYFCSLFSDDEVMLKKDWFGKTALHYATNKQVAKTLLTCVTSINQKDFILSSDKLGSTALHTAVATSQTSDLVKYFCQLSLADNQLFLHKDIHGKSVLHCAINSNVAKMLIESVALDKQKSFIFSLDINQRTALHYAALFSRTDVVKLLCSLPLVDNEFIFLKDKIGRTALQLAQNKESAAVIVKSVTPSSRQRDLLFSRDNLEMTALHVAASIPFGADLVGYLCKILVENYELVLAQNSYGQTALHIAWSANAVRSILFSLQTEQLPFLLMSEDNAGNTPLLSLTLSGNYNAFKQILEHIEDQCGSEVMLSCLQKQNKLKQNILHLAALSPCLDKIYDVLIEYLHNEGIVSMMYPDVHGNTPIHYVAAKYNVRVFADFMLHLPLPMRHFVVNHLNKLQTTCLAIIARSSFDIKYYVDNILGPPTNNTTNITDGIAPFAFISSAFKTLYNNCPYPYNQNIPKVLSHALNQYQISNNCLIASPDLNNETEQSLPEKEKVSYFLYFFFQFSFNTTMTKLFCENTSQILFYFISKSIETLENFFFIQDYLKH